MATNPDLNIRIAEAKGLNVVGMAHCWAPDGPPWSVLDESKETGDYSPVYLVPEEERTGETMLGFACGHPALDLRRVPDYTGDPREYVPLLEEMGDAFSEVRRETCHKSRFDQGFYFRVVLHPRIIQEDDGGCALNCYDAPTPGDAVCLACLAWLAVNETKENSHES